MRKNYENLPTHQWTDAEAMDHLTRLFDHESKRHPDVMEPYIVMLAGAPAEERKSIMRSALRETVSKRYGN